MKRLRDKGIELRIRQLLTMSGSSVKVVFENRFPGGRLVGGKYQPAAHTITLYRECIRNQCIQLFGTEDYLADYAAVIFAHELGHAEDPQLEQLAELLYTENLSKGEKRKIALRIEQNAWHFASKLFKEWKQAALFQEIVFQSLTSYYRAMMPDFSASSGTKKQPESA